MIRKLKTRFVILAMVTLWALLLLVISGLNSLNYLSLLKEADLNIDMIMIEREGQTWFQQYPESLRSRPNRREEIPFEARYFIIYLDENDEITGCDVDRMFMLSEEDALEYGRFYLNQGKEAGLVDWYRYRRIDTYDGSAVVFLDCGRKIDIFLTFMHIGIAMLFLGLGIGFLVIFFLSGRIVRPVAESHTKQKQFITDAGHEIKTPLTIINANLDLLEMDLGENECIEDIRQQTGRLRSLTNDLVLLSRMEEGGNTMEKIDFPLSDVVADAAKAFRAPLSQRDCELLIEIEPMLSMHGNSKALEQLTSILLDNAVKYSAPGAVCCRLERQGKSIVLSVSNPSFERLSEEQLSHLFDRFYRSDSSRNSETGGHGIGLSVALAIVTAHGGSIKAVNTEDMIFRITAQFPV